MRTRALVLSLAVALAAGACDESVPSDQTSSSGSGDSSSASSGSGSSSSGGGGAGGAAPDCFMNPMTHVEIINACTTAEKVDKQPVLPLLGKDGMLPPLP